MNRATTYRAIASTCFAVAAISAPSCTAFVGAPLGMNTDGRGLQTGPLPSAPPRVNKLSMVQGGDPDQPTSEVSDSRMMRFERKNASRKKFGLDPLSLEQFDEIEKQVRELEISQQEKLAQQLASQESRTSTSGRMKESKRRKGGVFDGILGGKMDNTCTSNEDCERPQVCCDLVLRKVCCSSGTGIFEGQQAALRPALVPVPATVQQDTY